VRFESGRFSEELIDNLNKKGYPKNTKADPIIGKVDAILIRPDGRLEGGADMRGDDAAAGF